MKPTKGKRRERIKRNQGKMRVTGSGLRNTWRIIAEKAEKARNEKATKYGGFFHTLQA